MTRRRRSDTAVTINVLANDNDPDGSLNPGTVTVVSPPASGSTVVNSDGTITYTPGTTLGNNTFTYTVKDNLGGLECGHSHGLRSRAADRRRRLGSDALGHAGDNQRARQRFRARRHARSEHGHDCDRAGKRQRLGQRGWHDYLHARRTVGNNTFTYTVANTSGDVSNAATVTVFVHEPPVAVNDSVFARSDRSATIAVLANDFDTDGTLDPTTVTIVSAPSSGSTVVNGNGTITFTPGERARERDLYVHGQGRRRRRFERGHGHGLRRRSPGRGQRLGPDARQHHRHDRRARQRSRPGRYARPDHGNGGDAPQQRLGAGQPERHHHLHARLGHRQRDLHLHGRGQPRRGLQCRDRDGLRRCSPCHPQRFCPGAVRTRR